MKHEGIHQQKYCLLCGAKFTMYREYQKYCSRYCRHRNWTINNKEKVNEYGRKYRTSENGKRVLVKHYASEKFKARIIAYQNTKGYKEYKKQYAISDWGRLKARQYTHNRKARIKANGGTFSAEEFVSIVEAFDYTCPCCKERFNLNELTPDHIVPLSKGGVNSIDNIQPLCLPCNIRKGVKTTNYLNVIAL